MDLSVTTSAQPLGNGPMIIQNLGTGNVYVDENPNVTTGTGVKIASGGWMAVGEAEESERYIIGDGAADVRVLPNGTAHS
jgi:hypothetical protein